MTRFVKLAVLLTMMWSTIALAQGGDVRARISIPGQVIVDYWSVLTINIPAAELSAAMYPSHTETLGGTLGGRARNASSVDLDVTFQNPQFEGDAVITPSGDALPLSQVDVLVQNAYVVRANRTATLITTLGSGTTLNNPAGGNIGVVSVTPSLVNIQALGLGQANAQYGNITLRLNLVNASHAGTYENAQPTFTYSINLP